ncbi:uncharacterized protein LOC132555945 [Ylistrum balloti]|uniref:uncharacterized protein LOC132555945 n=1 Tax=Ylistrum balloti TaxID=509963 RepID=UPI002905E9F0|nr:uncharacterized protein LOC132555945 [Ylistrum balloti]
MLWRKVTEMSEDVAKTVTECNTESPEKRKRKKRKYRRTKDESILSAHDFLPIRLLTLFGMTVCLALFIFQISTSLNSYNILHDMRDLEERFPDYMFGLHGEPNLWSWDPDTELLKVNTSLFIH